MENVYNLVVCDFWNKMKSSNLTFYQQGRIFGYALTREMKTLRKTNACNPHHSCKVV
jgi:hypothetical protein